MKKRLLYLTFIIAFFLFSCSKDNQDVLEVIQPDSGQEELLSKMKEASNVIAQFANNGEVKKELDEMIKMKMYNDDFVYFKDLFNPSSNENLKSSFVSKTNFERCYDNVVNINNEKSGEIEQAEKIYKNLYEKNPGYFEFYDSYRRILEYSKKYENDYFSITSTLKILNYLILLCLRKMMLKNLGNFCEKNRKFL